MAKRNHKRYTDEFRASSVLMLEAAGYPDKDGALSQVSKHLSVPISTLRGWFNKSSNPPPAKIRNEKRLDLKKAISSELGDIFNAMGNVRQDASYRDLAWAAGVLIDKKQILDGKPTWIIELASSWHNGELTKDDIESELPSELASEFFDYVGISQ